MSDFCSKVRVHKELVEEGRGEKDINKALSLVKAESKLYKIYETLEIKSDLDSLDYYNDLTVLVFDQFLNVVVKDEKIITPEDVSIVCDTSIATVTEFKNIEELMKHGNSLFDSLMYLSNKDQQDKIIIANKRSDIVDRSKQRYGRILIAYVCVTLVRGDPLHVTHLPNFVKEFCPNFIADYFKYLGSEKLLSKIGLDWMMKLNYEKFPEKIKNRLNMAICGYRYINCVSDYGIYTDDDSLNLIFNMCKALKSKGTFIDLHPKFINSQVSKLSIKIGKMCTYYILKVFNDKEKIMLESNKALPNNWFIERVGVEKYSSIKVNKTDVESMLTVLKELKHLLGGTNTMEEIDYYFVPKDNIRVLKK